MKPSAETKKTENEGAHDVAADAAKGAAVGAGVGAALWGMAGSAVGLLGFGANGIAAGSTAASMMSAAAVANGGGVAAGSTVAVLQSVGAVGLATPIGLGLVATGVVVGGAAVGIKALLTKRSGVDEAEEAADDAKKNEDPQDAVAGATASWLLMEWLPGDAEPVQTRFLSESEASAAYNKSTSTKRMLCRSDLTCIENTPECDQ